MPGPLEGIRVLDLSSGPAAGTATMVLGDFGADVIKVERPGGDPWRTLANAPVWLRGKRSIELDLADEGVAGVVHELSSSADVVVSTLRAESAERLGVAYEHLCATNPGLVYCRLSGFGPTGPYADYPGYEGVVAAKSGRMQAFAGLPGRDGPAYAAVQVGIHGSAQSAVAGILAALIARETTGRGQLVDTSLLQALLPYDLMGLLRVSIGRRFPEAFPADPVGPRIPTLNYHPLQTKDGKWLQMGNLLQHLFDNYLAASDLMDLYADPRFDGPQATWAPEALEAFRDRMIERARERTAEEWMETYVAHGGVAATVYHTTQEALADPDLVANGHVVSWEDGENGTVTGPGPVAKLSRTPGAVHAGAPKAGGDSEDVRRNGFGGGVKRTTARGAGKLGAPLDGVTILEFSTIIAAPLGASLLGDLGARVIKVEPIGGDAYRGLGPLGIMAAKTNQSKESIGVDLKDPDGARIVRELVAKADVLVHNYRPGVPERLGIGYEQVREMRPGIVYLSVNGYGPEGPGAHRPSTHPIPGAAVGGALYQAGAGMPPGFCETIGEVRAAAERLFRANEVNPDPNTAVVVATAALLGLYAQRMKGVGQQVFVDMLGASAWANLDDFVSYEGKAPRALPDYDLHGPCATDRLYRAQTGWVFAALVTDAEWRRFCALAGETGLAADARFATMAGRRADDAALADALGAVFAKRDADEWEALLAPQGIGCVRADGATPGEFWANDPHARENGFVFETSNPRYGEYTRHGPVVTLSETPARCGPGALGGQHTDELLRELGYNEGRIAELRRRDVVWSEEVAPLG